MRDGPAVPTLLHRRRPGRRCCCRQPPTPAGCRTATAPARRPMAQHQRTTPPSCVPAWTRPVHPAGCTDVRESKEGIARPGRASRSLSATAVSTRSQPAARTCAVTEARRAAAIALSQTGSALASSPSTSRSTPQTAACSPEKKAGSTSLTLASRPSTSRSMRRTRLGTGCPRASMSA